MQFTAKIDVLKKAMQVASQAIGEVADTIQSQAVVSVEADKVLIQATNEDKISFMHIAVESQEGTGKFSVTPKTIQTLLSSADTDVVRLQYDEAAKSLNVYASEDKDAFVSLPSCDTTQFISFDAELASAQKIETIDSTVLESGIDFMMGFISQDGKKPKFSNMYIKEGVMYAANGSSRVGLFKNDELAKIYSVTFRRNMLQSLMTFIDNASPETVTIKETNRMTFFTSPDEKAGFGFRKPAVDMPKMPITSEKPTCSGISVDRAGLLKKLNRLGVSLKKDAGWLDIEVAGEVMTLKTVAERPSIEHMACKVISGATPMSFMLDYATMKTVLALFKTTTIDLFVDENNRGTIYNTAELLIDEKVRKPFLAVALMILPRRTV